MPPSASASTPPKLTFLAFLDPVLNPGAPAKRAICPQSEDQAPGCGFPLLRLVGIFRLKTGALLEESSAPHTTSENALFQELWPTLRAGDILLGDRNFSSYGSLASFKAQDVDGLWRLHGSRKADLRRGQRLGPQGPIDHLE